MDLAELIASLKPRNQGARGKPRAWYDVGNLSTGGEAEIYIYDYIGYDSWFGGVGAADFVRELKGLNANKITLRINSPGGDITEANAIRTALAEHPATIETRIDGLAASSASWVGLVADKVVMSPHAMMMIHEPWNVVIGDAAAMTKEAEVLDKFANEIAAMFVEKAGGSVAEWRDRMRAETWYGDQEAVNAGLADEIANESSAASNRWDPAFLNIFKHAPAQIVQRQPPPAPTSNEDSENLARARLRLQVNELRRRYGFAA